MISISKWFFATAALCALCGMIWGIQISASNDHTLSPAHGHLNLVGFVALSIFGGYYALTPQAAQTRLAVIHLGLALAAVALLTPGIILALTGQGATLAKIGSVLAAGSMALFGFMVLRHGVGVQTAGRAIGNSFSAQPGE
ncbi:MAG: hypothetical protein EP318_06570 [Rhodobacteraceae bacterium]|nr:MAG: hypothetical protein EP318_06570 [Paracoccaceae bacterium]